MEPPAVILRVAIVGSGIPALVVAYALKKSGQDVSVFDPTDGNDVYNGSIPSPPNMTRLLVDLDLPTHLVEKLCRVTFVDATDGKPLGGITNRLFDTVAKDSMVDFGTIEHHAFHNLLRNLNEKSGVNFKFNTRVADVDETSPATIVLENGERLDFDLLVVMDGSNPKVRQYVSGEHEHTSDVKTLLLRATVKRESLSEDENFRTLVQPHEWNIWLGDGVALAFQLVPHNTETCYFEIQRMVPRTDHPELDETWQHLNNTGEYGLDGLHLESRMRKLLEVGNDWAGRVVHNYPAPQNIVSTSRRVVFAGEAAHPLIPRGHHHTSIIFEDAATLSFLCSKLQSREQLPKLLSAYDEIRHPRALSVHEYEVLHHAISTAPPGPIKDARDKRLSALRSFEDGGPLYENAIWEGWGRELAIVTYDAKAAAEGWWRQYGSTIVNQDSAKSDLRISIQRSKESLTTS